MKRILVFISVLLLKFNFTMCQSHNNNTDTLKNWERKYFTKPLDKPFLFYVVHGNFSTDLKLSITKYRTLGTPKGIEVMKYGPSKNPGYVQSFFDGYLWNTTKENDSVLTNKMMASKECLVIMGEAADTSNLNFLRDVVGLITCMLDYGGVSVYDPQGFMIMSKEEWNKKIFEPNGSVPRNHVMILFSEENGKLWYHTRGMRKFGRPDLSIHNVPPKYEDAIQDLFDRFIEYQGFGGIIADGQKIKMNTLPEGMWCEIKGDNDDPDFNNKHVEIYWK